MITIPKPRVPQVPRLTRDDAEAGLVRLLEGIRTGLDGPLGALPGAFLSLAGAFTLVGAAIATLVVDRHAERGSGV